MTDEFRQMVGAAIDAMAKAHKPEDGHIPLHLVEVIVGCTIQECSLHIGKIAEGLIRDWRDGLKADTYLEGRADGYDDAAFELLKVSGAVKVMDSDD